MSDKFNALKVQKIYNLSFIYLKNMAENKKNRCLTTPAEYGF